MLHKQLTVSLPVATSFHRERGGGGAGGAVAPPLFCAPAPLFALKEK